MKWPGRHGCLGLSGIADGTFLLSERADQGGRAGVVYSDEAAVWQLQPADFPSSGASEFRLIFPVSQKYHQARMTLARHRRVEIQFTIDGSAFLPTSMKLPCVGI